MSGHNKWSQIKNQKGATDKKRGQLFSKLVRAISIAAKTEPNPQFNPRLRSAIEKAEENSVPKDNIERAINKAGEEKNLEDIIVEAYGPEGSAIIIEGITDSKNRAISEIKHILTGQGGKIANPGSVLWSFNPPAGEKSWEAKFPQAVSGSAKEKINQLIEALEEHGDVQKVTTNMEVL